MAKKKSLTNLFAKTEAENAKTPRGRGRKPEVENDPYRPSGISLRETEYGDLDQIANELKVTRHQLLQYIIRDFIRRYHAGERPKTEKKTVLKMD